MSSILRIFKIKNYYLNIFNNKLYSNSCCEIARKEREGNTRNLANTICMDRDTNEIENYETASFSKHFGIFQVGQLFDERETICLLSNSMELCRWKILPRFIGDDLSQFYIENAFNFKMRQFHLFTGHCHRTYCKTSNVSLGL